jgi:hypothetical protein
VLGLNLSQRSLKPATGFRAPRDPRSRYRRTAPSGGASERHLIQEGIERSPARGSRRAGSIEGDLSGEARPLGLRRGVNLDKALQVAAAEEDGETVRKLELRK